MEMNMKKLFLSACVALAATFGLSAQNLSYRAEIGGNITGKYLRGGEVPGKHSPQFGLRAGVGVEYALAPSMYLASGLNYRMGGIKSDFTKYKVESREHNLSVPINIGARFALSRAFALSIEGGPFLTYTLSAKRQTPMGEVNLLDKSQKAFEVGAGISLAGELMNKYYLRLGTDWGLTDTYKNNKTPLKKMSNEVYLSLGIRF